MAKTNSNELNQHAVLVRQEIEALLRQYPDLADDEILRADMLDAETDIRVVLTDIHRMIDDAKSLRDGSAVRMEELIARRNRLQHRIDFGRDLLTKLLEAAQIRKIELPEVTLSIKNNPQQIVGEPNPDTLPDDLCKVTRTADRKKIREALDHGRDVPGCFLSNAPPSLLVRVK